jgi:NADPH:quinone reductase-like Zn-dependent oxidoreductase
MRALRLHSLGDPASLALEEIETPQVGPGEALVRVHAAAITRDELEWPVDRLPATPSYELSGVVAATGPDVEDVAPGDEVFALTGFDRDGAAADYALFPAGVLAPRPHSLGHVESAALPLAALSAWQGLFEHGRLESRQRVLIHGATGGVGHFAVQLARHQGAHVVATASGVRAGDARELGADEVVDAAAADFVDEVAPVDLVFDTVGGERLARSPAVVRPGGRIVSVATEPPADVEGIGSHYFVVEPNRQQLLEIARLVAEGALRPRIDQVFPLEEGRAAFEVSAGRHGAGKIVLRVADG